MRGHNVGHRPRTSSTSISQIVSLKSTEDDSAARQVDLDKEQKSRRSEPKFGKTCFNDYSLLHALHFTVWASNHMREISTPLRRSGKQSSRNSFIFDPWKSWNGTCSMICEDSSTCPTSLFNTRSARDLLTL